MLLQLPHLALTNVSTLIRLLPMTDMDNTDPQLMIIALNPGRP